MGCKFDRVNDKRMDPTQIEKRTGCARSSGVFLNGDQRRAEKARLREERRAAEVERAEMQAIPGFGAF